MPKLITADSFNWINFAANIPAVVTNGLQSMNADSPGSLSLIAASTAVAVNTRGPVSLTTADSYREYCWEFQNFSSSRYAPDGEVGLKCTVPMDAVYRKYKISVGMSMQRTSSASGLPVAIYIEDGQYGSGWYGITSTATQCYTEVLVDFLSGSVSILINSVEAVKYTFTKKLDQAGMVSNDIRIEFGNIRRTVYYGNGQTDVLSFWFYASGGTYPYWWPSSYYMAYGTTQDDNPLLGKIRIVSKIIPLTLTDMAAGGTAGSTDYDKHLGLGGGFSNPSTPYNAYYTTTTGKSSIKGSADNFTSPSSIIATGIKFSALSADPGNKAKLRLSIHDGDTELESVVQIAQGQYSARVERDPVIMIPDKETSTASTLSYSMVMA